MTQETVKEMYQDITSRLASIGIFAVYHDVIASDRGTSWVFNLPCGCSDFLVRKADNHYKSACNDKGTKVYIDKDYRLVVFFDRGDKKEKIHAWEMHRVNPPAYEIVLGEDDMGNGIHFSLPDAQSILVGGTAGSGKSVLLHNILDSLAKSKEPLILTTIDMKGVEFPMYSGESRIAKCYTRRELAIEHLKQLLRECESRYNKMRSLGIEKIDTKVFPYWVCIIDEYAELVSTEGKMINSIVTRIAQIGRACGVYLVVATQYPKASIIPTTVTANFPTRIGLMCENRYQSTAIIGRPDCIGLKGKGDAIIDLNGKTFRFQTYNNRRVDTMLLTKYAYFDSVCPHCGNIETRNDNVIRYTCDKCGGERKLVYSPRFRYFIDDVPFPKDGEVYYDPHKCRTNEDCTAKEQMKEDLKLPIFEWNAYTERYSREIERLKRKVYKKKSNLAILLGKHQRRVMLDGLFNRYGAKIMRNVSREQLKRLFLEQGEFDLLQILQDKQAKLLEEAKKELTYHKESNHSIREWWWKNQSEHYAECVRIAKLELDKLKALSEEAYERGYV